MFMTEGKMKSPVYHFAIYNRMIVKIYFRSFFVKRKTGLFGVFGLALLVLSLALTGCPTDGDDGNGGGGGGGGNGGWLTFSDTWPADTFTSAERFDAAFVVANDSTFTNKATLRDVAAVAYCEGNDDWRDPPGKKLQFRKPPEDSKVELEHSSTDDPAWAGSGNYTVVLEKWNKESYTTTYYTKRDVSFDSGNATVSWADFDEVDG
jgi:hypothetical protein